MTNIKSMSLTVEEFLLTEMILVESSQFNHQFIMLPSDLNKYAKFWVDPITESVWNSTRKI